jgi:hypothetical protein
MWQSLHRLEVIKCDLDQVLYKERAIQHIVLQVKDMFLLSRLPNGSVVNDESLLLLHSFAIRIPLHLALGACGSDFDLCRDRLESTAHFGCCF